MKISLKEHGLNKYESDAYVTLVREGVCTATQVSKESGVPHGKIYPTLHSLEEKGYVRKYVGPPQRFLAIEPKIVIEESIRRREVELKEFKMRSKKLLKDLGPLSGRKPSEATERIRTIQGYRNYLNLSVELHDRTKEEWLTISRLPVYKPLLDAYKRCVDRGVKVRVLAHVTDANRKNLAEWKKIGAQIRELTVLGARFSVIDKTSAIVRMSGEGSYLAMWIQSQSLATSARNYFEFLWKKSKKL